jgi:hypothetical protein
MISITRPKWVGTVFIVIGIGLLVVGLWFGAEAALFAVNGATTTGTVVSKRIDPNYFSSTSRTSTQDPTGYLVTVDFTPEGGSRLRTELLADHAVWDGLVVGQQVAVSYVRMFPQALNTLGDQSGGSSAGPLLVGLLALVVGFGFASSGAWLLLSTRRMAALMRRLSAVGVSTTGTVVDNDAREMRIGSRLQRRLRYRYADSTGAEHSGMSDWMPRAQALDWKRDTTGVVRYDPDRPEVSAWFGDNKPADPRRELSLR